MKDGKVIDDKSIDQKMELENAYTVNVTMNVNMVNVIKNFNMVIVTENVNMVNVTKNVEIPKYGQK